MRNRHSLLMVICCMVPIGVLFALPFLGIGFSSLSFLVVILLCPLLHLLMIRRAHGDYQPVDVSRGLEKPDRKNEHSTMLSGKGSKWRI